MIIDAVLDRKNGVPYSPRAFYNYVTGEAASFPEIASPIASALDSGEEEDVRRELCAYVVGGGYNPTLCDYINSMSWLKEESAPKASKEIKTRLEYLRGEIESETIDYAGIAELQSLAEYIDQDDMILLEWAGVPENIVRKFNQQ